ncbi:MAG: hypothetical protein ACKO9V_05285, partial [Candidatus Kapaibacterium sp.]
MLATLFFIANLSDLAAASRKKPRAVSGRSSRVKPSSAKKGKKSSARSRAARRREIARARAEARVPKALRSIT